LGLFRRNLWKPPALNAPRRSLRLALRTLIALVWIVLLLLVLEVAERARIAAMRPAANRLNVEQINAMRDAWAALPPADRPEWAEQRAALGRPESVGEVDAAKREAYLQNRNALAAVVDRDAAPQACLPDTAPDALQPLRAWTESEQTLLAGMPRFIQTELLQYIDAAIAGQTSEEKHYGYDFPDGSSDMVLLQAQPWPEPGRALVVMRPSIWREWMFAFSPHVYVPDMYGREEIWTNALGYRDDEIAVPKPEGVYRIVCIGGSTTLEGVRNDQTYPNLLEAKLREALNMPDLEVINTGVYGLNSAGETRKLDQYLDLYPDFIVHYNFINDLSPLIERAITESPDPRVRLWPALRHWRFAHHYLNRWLVPGTASWRAWMKETTFEHRRQLVEAAEERRIPLALASFARPDLASCGWTAYEKFRDMTIWLFDHDYIAPRTYVWLCDLYNRELQSIAKENVGVTYLPIAEQLTGCDETFVDICHLTHEGIHRKAEIMFNELLPLIRADLLE